MEKVVNINLGGNAYMLEEAAYDALQRYLGDARSKLAADPDREEILSDLEVAIAAKLNAYLSPAKTVVTTEEMTAALAAMGPVDPANESSASEARSDTYQTPPFKKLYRISGKDQGAIVFGVCNGLAAYFGVDVTLVRLIFILLTIVTGGGFVFGYILMMVFIPEAETPEERAQAFGAKQMTAQELVDEARKSYEKFANSAEWNGLKHHMRQETREWKKKLRTMHETHRHDARAYKNYARHYGRNYPFDYQRRYSPVREFFQMIFGIFWLLFWAFIVWFLYVHVPAVHQFLNLIGGWLSSALNSVTAWLSTHVHS